MTADSVAVDAIELDNRLEDLRDLIGHVAADVRQLGAERDGALAREQELRDRYLALIDQYESQAAAARTALDQLGGLPMGDADPAPPPDPGLPSRRGGRPPEKPKAPKAAPAAFVCGVCEETFSRPQALGAHRRYKHRGTAVVAVAAPQPDPAPPASPTSMCACGHLARRHDDDGAGICTGCEDCSGFRGAAE